MLLSVVIQRYLRHHRTRGSSPHTLEWHTVSLGQFLATTGDKEVEALDTEDLRGFLDALRGRGVAQATLATRHRSVKAFGAWLVEEGYADKHPFHRVQRPQVDKAAKAVLTVAQVRDLLALPDKSTLRGLRDWAMMSLLYSTGLRAEELCNLRLADIDEANQHITVTRGKGGKFRLVPYLRPAERAVNRYLAHPKRREARAEWVFTSLLRPTSRISPDNLGLVIRQYGNALGLHVYPHLLRHTFAVHYLRLDGSMEDLQEILGHTTQEMTRIYGKIAAVDLVRRHRKADPLGNL